MEFYERVKLAARQNGTTIEYLAEKAGLTRGAYNTYRRRGYLPRADEALIIAQELGTTVEYLVGGEPPGEAFRPALRVLISRLEPRTDEELARVSLALDALFGPAARGPSLDEIKGIPVDSIRSEKQKLG
jgi:transcriptional regulator with XRE-family HTH domain